MSLVIKIENDSRTGGLKWMLANCHHFSGIEESLFFVITWLDRWRLYTKATQVTQLAVESFCRVASAYRLCIIILLCTWKLAYWYKIITNGNIWATNHWKSLSNDSAASSSVSSFKVASKSKLLGCISHYFYHEEHSTPLNFGSNLIRGPDPNPDPNSGPGLLSWLDLPGRTSAFSSAPVCY